MALRSVRPLGIYRARTLRDGESMRRDGQPYVLMNRLPSTSDAPSIEVMFGDGEWLLATPADLDPLPRG